MKEIPTGLKLCLALGATLSSIYSGQAVPVEIVNYATADALIGGANLAYSVSAPYTLANVQDDGDGSGPFGLGTQIVGLPPGNNDDFAFVGTGTLVVNTAGTYVFKTNTDDGSRLRIDLNQNVTFEVSEQVITDDVLSGPHTVPSAGITLAAGNYLFEWMWFERGGGAEGELFYSQNSGPDALVGDPSQGVGLLGGTFIGTVYKSGEPGVSVPEASATLPLFFLGLGSLAVVGRWFSTSRRCSCAD